MQREFELTIQEIDIEDNLELYERYWDKIPVLRIDEHTTLYAPLRIADVRNTLENS